MLTVATPAGLHVLALVAQLCPKLDYHGADGADDPAVRSSCCCHLHLHASVLLSACVLISSTMMWLPCPRLREALKPSALPNSFGLRVVRSSMCTRSSCLGARVSVAAPWLCRRLCPRACSSVPCLPCAACAIQLCCSAVYIAFVLRVACKLGSLRLSCFRRAFSSALLACQTAP